MLYVKRDSKLATVLLTILANTPLAAVVTAGFVLTGHGSTLVGILEVPLVIVLLMIVFVLGQVFGTCAPYSTGPC
jgi:hypothetical protein